ncbi:Uncharacterised protein [Mycobacteroides abscessus subsp. abscessus]|nr:Uncharacterised protein [Mycobacteroides abscessus subsp. abscessus]
MRRASAAKAPSAVSSCLPIPHHCGPIPVNTNTGSAARRGITLVAPRALPSASSTRPRTRSASSPKGTAVR